MYKRQPRTYDEKAPTTPWPNLQFHTANVHIAERILIVYQVLQQRWK